MRKPLPQRIVDHIRKTMNTPRRGNLVFSRNQIQRLVREFGIVRSVRGGFDTDEEGMFLEGLARKFVGCQWPCNSIIVNERVAEITGIPAPPKDFEEKFIQGYERYKKRAKP